MADNAERGIDTRALQRHRTRSLPIRFVRARARLFISIGVGIGAGLALSAVDAAVGAVNGVGLCPPCELSATRTQLLLAWNVGAITFLVSSIAMMLQAGHQTIRRQAAIQDEGQVLILTLATMAGVACIGAIIWELGNVKGMAAEQKGFHIGLALVTIVTAWSFVHVMFALHYAHEYYEEWKAHPNAPPQLRGGLDFPGGPECPAYADFLYFSFVIGVASATADVSITSAALRRVALAHCVLAFFYNLAILGLTINISAGLLNK